ncbi:MAG: J domain-containing protein [Anderseniella sp.]|jgi:hypothetical protein|nr:J domain-containing protein [Anderseniella sp.]
MKGSSEPVTLEIAARLVDGTVMRGFIVAGITGQLEPTLNKDAPFVEFVGHDGRRAFIAKSQLAAVEPVEPLRKPLLEARKPGTASCHELLGVAENCSFDEARDAYHRLVKLYHPDLYANAQLPKEVIRYATDMFSQVSSAWAEIKQRFNRAA